jgi:predicted aspartyl protease
MGRIVVETTLENALDPIHTIRCDALVDTGAAYLTLPNAWRDRLGTLTELDTVAVERPTQA